MSKLNKILSIVLGLQLALTAFIFWPKPAAPAGQPLFADVTAGDVVKLTIKDNDGNVLGLAKNGAGWVLPEADDFSIPAGKISELLAKLEGIKTNRLVTQTQASHNRLKVGQDDFNRLIELKLADGTRHTLYVGSSGGAGVTHVRADDHPQVYLADINAFNVNAQPAGWIDAPYVEIPQESVVAAALKNTNGTFEFTKDGDSWTMLDLAGDEVFNEYGLTGMLTNAATVRMTAPLGKEAKQTYGFDNPLAESTLTYQKDNSSPTLPSHGGTKADENSYYLKSSESPYYVTVSGFTGDSFVNKTRADFLQAPPAEDNGTAGAPESSGSN